MATIASGAGESVFQIKQWFGINQNPDGDTKLKLGEAAEMRNWTVTRDGNLRKRPGAQQLFKLGSSPVTGLWHGIVAGREIVAATVGNKAYLVYDEGWPTTPTQIGTFADTPDSVFMYGFADELWFLTGTQFLAWNGTSFYSPVGYRPLVAVTVPPAGGGTTLEGINKLNGLRRVWLSPDGAAVTFQLPEKSLLQIEAVVTAGTNTPITGWTGDTANGTVTFSTAPARGVNTIEVQYKVGTDFRSQISAMRFAESYNGIQDSRVFLYGDGTNRTIYSGVDYSGAQRGDYFPDLNEMSIGSQNTPITSLIRHGSTMVIFKSDCTYSCYASSITDAEGLSVDAFYSRPINKSVGNIAPGQAQLVLNFPRSVHGSDIYEWKNVTNSNGTLTLDERHCKRISDRVHETLKEAELSGCITFDDNYNQLYYMVCGNKVLVHNYAVDAWFIYTGLDIRCMSEVGGRVLFGTSDGRVMELHESVYCDIAADGTHTPIDCYWESGSMSFGQDYRRKFSAMTWIGIKPEGHSEVDVSIETDRAEIEGMKEVIRSVWDFGDIDFQNMDFSITTRPQMQRVKLKAKKFVYYKLKLSLNSAEKTATVTSADIKVRFSGYAK